MSADLKPGDRVRVKSCDMPKFIGHEGSIIRLFDDGMGNTVAMVDANGEKTGVLMLHADHLEPAPTTPVTRDADASEAAVYDRTGLPPVEFATAAPASEPEMRNEVASAIAQHFGMMTNARDIEAAADDILPIIARHLAERDARIAELEERLKACASAAEPPEDEHGIWTGSIVEAVQATADRARAAEAALAEEREAEERAAKAAVMAVIPLEAITAAGSLDAHCEAVQQGIAEGIAAVRSMAALRSRTITAEAPIQGAQSMGYNTVAVILNDALHAIEGDRQVGQAISRGVRGWYGRERDPYALDIPAGGHCPAIRIISQDHADDEQVTIVHGNSGCLADDATGLTWRALDQMQRCLERHGYKVTKPRKPRSSLSPTQKKEG